MCVNYRATDGEVLESMTGFSTAGDRLQTSFTQLTVRADGHPLMSRFHRPTHEKRSLVVIPGEQAADWLQVGNPEIARSYMQLYPAELILALPAHKGYGRR